MARHFVGLKLALLGSSLQRDWQRTLGLAVGALVGLPLTLVLAWGLWRAPQALDPAGPLLVALALALVGGWALLPLLAFGIDDTLDPAKLRLLPLSRWQLTTGLLAAAAVGLGPAATALLLIGAGAGFAPQGPALVLAVAALLAWFVLCLVTSRAVTAALSNRLRSRRGRDLLLLAAPTLGLLGAAAGQLPRLLSDVDADQLAVVGGRLMDVAPLLPPAWPALSVLAAGEGAWLVALAWLTATVALIAALAWWWMRALDRTLATPEATSAKASRSQAPLIPRALAWLPATPTVAAAGRDLREAWQVPQRRISLLLLLLLAAAVLVGGVVGSRVAPEVIDDRVVQAAALLALVHALGLLNQLGHDRGAWWTVLAIGAARADLAGRNLATVVVVLPPLALTAVVLAAATGGWSQLPGTLALALGVLALGAGIGNVTSVLVPAPYPDRPSNLWGSGSGVGCVTMLWQALAVTVAMVLLAPVGAAAVVTMLTAPQWQWAVGLGGLVYLGALWVVGWRLAVRIVEARGPQILAALSQRVA